MSELSGDRLIALARATDAKSRDALLLALGDLCAERSFGTGEDAETAEDVFLRLARNAELAVRAELATRLAATPWAPRALILLLAHDEIEAAEPVLAGSPVLREADMIDIACQLGHAHRRALARRPGLSSKACEAVARPRECDVIRVLLANPSADVHEDALRHCTAAAEAEPGLWSAIVERDGLSEDVVHAAYRAVGDALKDAISERYPQFADLLAGEADAAVESAKAARGPGMSANERLVEELYGAGGLTEDFFLEAAQDGRINLFELGLARLCETDSWVIGRALDRRGAAAAALAFHAAGLNSRYCVRLVNALTRAGRLKGGLNTDARRDCACAFTEHTAHSALAALRRLGAEA
mgnify:CR=1 FL=1